MKCITCGEDKKKSEFYSSANPFHGEGVIPYCKDCLRQAIGNGTQKEVREVLRRIDRPFILKSWESAVRESAKKEEYVFGNYMKHLGMQQNRELTWADSDFIGMEKYVIGAPKEELLTNEERNKLVKKWGVGHDDELLMSYENKYEEIKIDYKAETTMHEEALRSYCKYKVKADVALANDDFDNAKKLGDLAQKQGEIAKINVNKLSSSDFTQGIDGFSDLARKVEESIDIIPLLAEFQSMPLDEVDYAIYFFVDYLRKLEDKPRISYHELYGFYEKNLNEMLETMPEMKKYVKKKQITNSLNGRKHMINIVNMDERIAELRKENPNNAFYQDLDKWADVVAYLRWYPDRFYDYITPSKGGIELGVDQRILLRVLSRFKFNMGVFSRGYGKCISGDSFLFTSEGMKEIQDFFELEENDEEQIMEQDIDLINRYGQLENSDKGVYSGFKQTKRIRTEEGYEIEGTLKHPLLVMTKSGELKWKEIQQIETGDFISISRNNDVWGNKIQLNIDMKSWLDTFNKTSRWQIERVKCKVVDAIDEEMALIMGYLVGDGGLTRNNAIYFTNKDEDILMNFFSFMENRLEVKVARRSEIDYEICGMYTREYFRQLGLECVDAFGKSVPKTILEAPKNVVASFIRGLFDTDGGLSNSYIEYCTASEKMSKQVQTILLNFGIISTRTKKYNKKFDTYSYRITIYGKNMDLYLKEIGFSTTRKQNKLIELCKVKRNPNKDVIPYQEGAINLLFEEKKKAGAHNTKLFNDFYNVRKGNNELTYERIKTLDKEYNGEIDNLEEIYNAHYFYSKVKTIEDNQAHVYDLQVPITNSFIANGIVNHNTMVQNMGNYHTCIFYPRINVSMTAQTVESSAQLLLDKYNAILNMYPYLKNEISDKTSLNNKNPSIAWKSGARYDSLPNTQASKGQRRERLTMEESAQVNQVVYTEAIEPIANIPRRTVGELAMTNPYELNGAISRFTTAWYKNTNEYDVSLKMKREMLDLKGTYTIGGSWELPNHFRRGEAKSAILRKKENNTLSEFAFNYGSEWMGIKSGALVDIGTVMTLRGLEHAEMIGSPDGEYYLGVDVARSEEEANNKTMVVVAKVNRNMDNRVSTVSVVNMINIPATQNFRDIAQDVMRIQKRYKAKMVVVDANSLGSGLVDNLVLEQIDTETRESLGCWKVVNTEQESQLHNAEEVLYALKSQGINHDIIINFMDYVSSGRLTLLRRKDNLVASISEMDVSSELLPFYQTDRLLEELANLKLKEGINKKFTVEQQTRKIDKDRYSALAYVLWYINTFENEYSGEDDFDITEYLLM